jgi:hypothetical protein
MVWARGGRGDTLPDVTWSVRRFEERRGLSKRRGKGGFEIWEEGDQCYTGMDKEGDRRKEEEEGGRRK